jgi:hypothetical protein
MVHVHITALFLCLLLVVTLYMLCIAYGTVLLP